jgi:hypothetical protein
MQCDDALCDFVCPEVVNGAGDTKHPALDLTDRALGLPYGVVPNALALAPAMLFQNWDVPPVINRP